MHDQQLPMFEGYSYPTVKATLAGGLEGSAADELLSGVADLQVGESFRYVVVGTVASKKHSTKFDKNGIEERVLTVTLKADGIMDGGDLTVTFLPGGAQGEIEDPVAPRYDSALEAIHAVAPERV